MFAGALVLLCRGKTIWSLLQVIGVAGLMVVGLCHVCEALHSFSRASPEPQEPGQKGCPMRQRGKRVSQNLVDKDQIQIRLAWHRPGRHSGLMMGFLRK
jgi:hypothetical protein